MAAERPPARSKRRRNRNRSRARCGGLKCSFCGRGLTRSNGWLEFYGETPDGLRYPNVGDPVVRWAHRECGPDSGYSLALERITPESVSSQFGWLHHVGMKLWCSDVYLDALEVAARLAQIERDDAEWRKQIEDARERTARRTSGPLRRLHRGLYRVLDRLRGWSPERRVAAVIVIDPNRCKCWCRASSARANDTKQTKAA